MPAAHAAPAPSAAVPPLPAPSAHESASAHGNDPLRQALATARAFLSDGGQAPAAPTAASTSQPSALELQMQHAALVAEHDLSSRAYRAQNGGRSRPQPVAHAHGAPLESTGASQGASQNVLEVCRLLAGLVEDALSVGACSISADVFCFARLHGVQMVQGSLAPMLQTAAKENDSLRQQLDRAHSNNEELAERLVESKKLLATFDLQAQRRATTSAPLAHSRVQELEDALHKSTLLQTSLMKDLEQLASKHEDMKRELDKAHARALNAEASRQKLAGELESSASRHGDKFEQAHVLVLQVP